MKVPQFTLAGSATYPFSSELELSNLTQEFKAFPLDYNFFNLELEAESSAGDEAKQTKLSEIVISSC